MSNKSEKAKNKTQKEEPKVEEEPKAKPQTMVIFDENGNPKEVPLDEVEGDNEPKEEETEDKEPSTEKVTPEGKSLTLELGKNTNEEGRPKVMASILEGLDNPLGRVPQQPKIEETPKLQQFEVSDQIEFSRKLAESSGQTQAYFLGCTFDCGKWSMTIGGHSFARVTTDPQIDQTRQHIEPFKRGNIVYLEEEKVKKLKKDVLNKGLRFIGKMTTTFTVDSRGFQKNEWPIACFVYIHKVKDLNSVFEGDWREKIPMPTLMKRDELLLTWLGNGFQAPNGRPIPMIPFQNEQKFEELINSKSAIAPNILNYIENNMTKRGTVEMVNHGGIPQPFFGSSPTPY